MKKADEKVEAHAVPETELAELLNADLASGLTRQEAEKRLKEFGENRIEREKKRNVFLIFLSQFRSPIVYLLFVAAGLSFYFGEVLDGSAILSVIIINSIIAFFMEYQAELSMQTLMKMVTVKAKIYREKQLWEDDSEKIVPGDIIYLEAGDLIPADARLVKGEQVLTDESALTGESVPVEKQMATLEPGLILAERGNMLYKGTHLSKGNAWGLVTATGMQTELGRIAHLVESAEQAVTPLEKRLEDFSKKLIKVTVALVVIIFIAGLLYGQELKLMLGTSIALAVAAIPEGLPIVATLALAQGMLRLARFKVIVKKLSAVETLGGVNIICADKTGTLTENKIKVAAISAHDLEWKEGEEPPAAPAFGTLLRIGVLCNTAALKEKDGEITEIGDPLETGLLKFAIAVGEDFEALRSKYPKIKEEPFSSETKIMSTLHRFGEKLIVYIKGASEEILQRSTNILEQDKIIPFDEERKKSWFEKSEQMAASGLRMIAGAFREAKNENEKELSNDLVFAGLYGMMDPPRKEVFKALEECRTAGIKVIMLTGDHPSTARNIALRLGIGKKNADVVNGAEMKDFESLSSDEKSRWLNTSIFARVNPAQKLDLIKVLQEEGNTVAMTGDGVNDAPALKKADIGIAMGERGTQVAQEVADMVLKDNSFNSIVTAIKQGRVIFENIRKFVIFLLSCNLSELLVISVGSVFNLHFQLFPIQILFINLITDVLPALALGVTPGGEGVMKEKPRRFEDAIIDKMRWKAIIFYSSVLAATSIGAVYASHYTLHRTEEWNPELGNNVLFFALIFSQLLHVLNMGSGTGLFKTEVFRNKYIWFALIASLGILFINFLFEPLRKVLHLFPMSSGDAAITIGSGFLSLLVIHLVKKSGLLGNKKNR